MMHLGQMNAWKKMKELAYPKQTDGVLLVKEWRKTRVPSAPR